MWFDAVPVLLAHGALGWWDEILFAGVAIVFVAIMILSWLRSRALPPEEINPASAPDAEASTPERFKLD